MARINCKPGKSSLLIPAGLLLLAGALLLTAYNLWDSGRAAASVQHILREMSAAVPEQAVAQISGETISPQEAEEATILVEGNEYLGTLCFPTLDLTLPVMSGWDYGKLKIAPCRYQGSLEGNLVIAGHNYPSHFGPLMELAPGDQVQFTDVEGNRFSYVVAQTEVLAPTAIEAMTGGNWGLTLFTCTASGQARFTVRCVPDR